MSLYLRNATWIDPETFKATTTTIKVEEGPSGGMALDAHAPVECPPEDTVLDCTGRLVTPSFGCGHHHIYSALARGMPPAPKAPANFLEVLEYVWWRMDKKLDHDMIEASALVTGLYCAKNGVTFVIDHHASPFHLDGSLETIAKALDRVGLGHLLDLPLSILGHCGHLDAEERDIIRTSPCWVVQNTESNLNNNVGLGRYNDFPRVMLGTDGMHSDMIRRAQSSYFISGLAEGGMSPLAAYQRLRAVHAHIQGHNAPGGGANNLVILNYDSPTPLTQDNFPGHFCYAFDARNVESVISQGRLIVDHGRLAGMDEADILAYANEQARRLWALL